MSHGKTDTITTGRGVMFGDSEADGGWAIPIGWTRDNEGRCRSCNAEVLWCLTPAGKKAPIDRDGKSHFATCPQADQWRKRGGS